MAAFALTIFTGAFLLFQVQPLIAKYILPWFGGGPGVWTTCMLFFQVLLLGGYAYAHFTSRWLKPRTQAIVHLVLLAVSLAMLPITPSDAWKPTGAENPTLRILALLTVSLGLPYFVLSSTGPLMQQWFSQANPGKSPYRLYALSNVGSLLALLSYPFFFETHLTRKAQSGLWAGGLVAFVIFCGFCAVKLFKVHNPQSPPPSPESTGAAGSDDAPRSTLPTLPTRLLWLLLPACASMLLLATTNKMCQDVAVIPFLWVVPLSLYLLTFIICFDSPRWYVRGPFTVALALALAALCWALPQGVDASLGVLLPIYSVGLFVCCMVCHGELYRLKPDPKHLTGFYLMIAAGGALGGVLVAVVAPVVFNDYYELPWGLLLCGVLFLVITGREQGLKAARKVQRLAYGGLWIGLGVLGIAFWMQAHQFQRILVERARNFYGVLTVFEDAKDNPMFHHFALVHGQIRHGLQFVNPVGASYPTTYFDMCSGVGRALRSMPPGGRRIGVIGLGIGTLAAYARTNDYYRFYEINPDVMRLATKYFRYAAHCPAKIDCAIGDARLSLEREPAQQFDFFVLDAFTGDAIPSHLLTDEAFAGYQRHMQTNGIIAVHISNRYLNLEPVLANLAQKYNYNIAVIESNPWDQEVLQTSPTGPNTWWIRSSKWVLLTRDAEFLKRPLISKVARQPSGDCARVPLWTDDFTSLYQVLK